MIHGQGISVVLTSAMPQVALSLAAIGCVAVGVVLCARASTSGDGMVRSLLHDTSSESDSVSGVGELRPHVNGRRVKAWILGAALFGSLSVFLGYSGLSRLALYALLGGVAGEVTHRRKREGSRKDLTRRLEFSLPTAMERVVMAVGSGLDIIPALSEAARGGVDPVSDVFRRIVSLSEGGLRVEHAIQITADSVPSSAIKHALVHLGLAYKQGGEVVRPLKEISDATQTQYQESVEEEIAKLPVRAVLPLILTFTGLIICFLTVPIVQVGSSLEKFTHAVQ
jgi:hypothetical protein